MSFEKQPGQISVFKNDRKEKDSHPDYRIIGLGLDGQKIRGALWLKKDRNGNTFMSGKMEPDLPRDGDGFPQRQQDVSPPRQGGGGSAPADDPFGFGDGVPF